MFSLTTAIYTVINTYTHIHPVLVDTHTHTHIINTHMLIIIHINYDYSYDGIVHYTYVIYQYTKGHSRSPCPQKNCHNFSLE